MTKGLKALNKVAKALVEKDNARIALPTLTELEIDVLDGCYRSEYNDGGNHFDIWSWSCAPRKAGVNQVSGVVSSLVKKGLVTCDGAGTKDDDNTIRVTLLGIEVARSLGFFEVRESDGMELYNSDHADAFRPAMNKKASQQEVLDVIATATPEQIVRAVDKVLAKVATQSKKASKDIIEVRVGPGLAQVLSLDDAAMRAEMGVVVKFAKTFLEIAGTRKSMEGLLRDCEYRTSGEFDQPLWYTNSAAQAAKKIRVALGGK